VCLIESHIRFLKLLYRILLTLLLIIEDLHVEHIPFSRRGKASGPRSLPKLFMAELCWQREQMSLSVFTIGRNAE